MFPFRRAYRAIFRKKKPAKKRARAMVRRRRPGKLTGHLTVKKAVIYDRI